MKEFRPSQAGDFLLYLSFFITSYYIFERFADWKTSTAKLFV